MQKINELDHNAVSLAGEFAVLSQLVLRGFDANMTLGHTKGVDILVSDPKNNRMFKIEVKTGYGGKPSSSRLFGNTISWMMSEKHESIVDDNLFYCFVHIEKTTNVYRFFIVPSRLVARYVKNQHQYWLRTVPGVENTIIRQFRIGVGNKKEYKISTLLATDYENKWDFKVE
jgi:hypothetical protein